MYRLSLRWSTDRSAAHGVPGSGFALEPEARPATSAQRTSTVTAQVAARVAAAPREVPAGYLYVPLAPGRRSWQTRVFGLVGIVIIVAVAAAVLWKVVRLLAGQVDAGGNGHVGAILQMRLKRLVGVKAEARAELRPHVAAESKILDLEEQAQRQHRADHQP